MTQYYDSEVERLYALLHVGSNTSPVVDESQKCAVEKCEVIECAVPMELDIECKQPQAPVAPAAPTGNIRGMSDPKECFDVFRFNIEPVRLMSPPYPAPPPRLHYTTWWRSMARKIYAKQILSIKQEAANAAASIVLQQRDLE